MSGDAFEGDRDGFDEALGVKLHAVDAGDAVVGVPLAQGAPVVDDEPGVLARGFDDRVMARAGGDLGIDQHKPQIMMDYPHVQGGYSLGYGLGWRVLDYHGHVVQQHTGKIEGYSAFQFYLPEEGSGAVFLQNLHAPDNPFIFTVQGLLLDYFLGQETQDWVSIYTEKREHAPEDMYHHLEFNFMPQKAVAGTAASYELAAYIGDYYHPAYGTFKICLEKGQLWLHERDILYCPMTHFHYDTFQVEQIKEDTDIYTLPLNFLIDKAKHTVEGFTLQLEPKVKEIVFNKIKPPPMVKRPILKKTLNI